MPIVSIAIELTAYCNTGAVTVENFLTPLNIQSGEAEVAWVGKGQWGASAVRISSIISGSESISIDSEARFDTWSAGTFRAAINFLNSRQSEVFASMKASGIYLRLEVEIIEYGPPTIYDFPPELYQISRIHDISLCSIYPASG